VFFGNILILGLTTYLIFAYADSVFLKMGLFDKAPTHDFIAKDDDRLFLRDDI